MKFHVGDRVMLTAAGEEHFCGSDPFRKGTQATVKAVDSKYYACEFDFENFTWLHDCYNNCARFRGRWLNEDEIELACVFEPANIIELL